MLNLTESQRRRYFYALGALGEKDVLTHYDLLFDIYCAAINMCDIENFIMPVFHNNLNTRYGYGAALSSDICQKKALHSIADQLKSLYPDNPLVSQDLPSLIDLIDKEDDENVGESLFYLAKWEAFGFVTGSFIACLICHMNKKLTNYRDIHLNMGSYLVRMVFLSSFENRAESFHNNDFQYLVRILTEYRDPCLAVLTHLAFLGQRPTPTLARHQIAEYLVAHKELFRQSILKIQDKLDEGEIEEYMSYIVSLSLEINDKEKLPFYTALRGLLAERYAQAPFAPLLNELLGFYINGHFSKGFLDRPFPEIIDKFKNCSPDTAYLLFDKMLYFDKNYIIYCPSLVDLLLKSKFESAPLELSRYLSWEPEKNKYNDEYITVAKRLYDHCLSRFKSRSLISQNEHNIKGYYIALKQLEDNCREAPDCYNWMEINTAEKIIARLSENCQYLLEVATWVIFRERKWGRYGLLVYLKHLLMNSLFPMIGIRAYEDLDELDKLMWLEKNIASIQPLIHTNDKFYVNTTYIALLDLFLTNEGNIQDRKSELDILNRVASDVQQAVPIIFRDDKARCARIQNMIIDYCHAIMT